MESEQFAERILSYLFRAAGGLTRQTLAAALRGIAKAIQQKQKQGQDLEQPGKTSIGELSKRGDTIDGFEVTGDAVAGFNEYAKSYGLQYSLIQEKNDPTQYLFSFRQKDIEKVLHATKDFLKDGRDHGDLDVRVSQAKEKAMHINAEKAKEQMKQHTRGKTKQIAGPER